MTAIKRGFRLSAISSAILVAIAAFTYLPTKFSGLKGVADRKRRGCAEQAEGIAAPTGMRT